MSDIPDYVMELWLEQCYCCPSCNQVPRGGVMQGGLCAAMPCRCEEEHYSDWEYEDDEQTNACDD